MDFTQTLIATSVGAGLGFVGSYLVSRVERGRANEDELRRTTAAYQAQVATAVARLRELPRPTDPGALAAVHDRIIGEEAVWVRTQQGLIRALGPNWREPIEQALATGAQLRLMDPPPALLNAMDVAEDYLGRLAKDRNPKLLNEWSTVHAQLTAAAKSSSRS